jgi:hypothetical protein
MVVEKTMLISSDRMTLFTLNFPASTAGLVFITLTSDKAPIDNGRIAGNTASFPPGKAHNGRARFAASTLMTSSRPISRARASSALAK